MKDFQFETVGGIDARHLIGKQVMRRQNHVVVLIGAAHSPDHCRRASHI